MQVVGNNNNKNHKEYFQAKIKKDPGKRTHTHTHMSQKKKPTVPKLKHARAHTHRTILCKNYIYKKSRHPSTFNQKFTEKVDKTSTFFNKNKSPLESLILNIFRPLPNQPTHSENAVLNSLLFDSVRDAKGPLVGTLALKEVGGERF